MRTVWGAFVVACLAAPAGARAGVVLGIGMGVARPGGSIASGGEMTDFTSVMMPVELQAGWKFGDRLTVAGVFAVVFGKIAGQFEDLCSATGDDCYVLQRRIGGQARWNFRPDRRLDPWVGAGVAHEWLSISRSTSSSGGAYLYQGIGWDFVGGADWWVTTRFSVSPWLGLSVGRYGEFTEDTPDASWQPVPSATTHTLFTAGVRIGWTFGAAARTEAPSAPAAAGAEAPAISGR